MKRFFCLCLIMLFISSLAFAGATKKTKSQITFKGFGTLTLEQMEKTLADKKLTNSNKKFKGKGIVGSLAGKFALQSGKEGELIDLTAMTICTMDHKNKEYTLREIKPIAQGEMEAETADIRRPESVQSNIKIIRSEFKVEETGESKKINNFACKKYGITWITEWENTQTGQKGKDRLATDVWTTAVSADLQQAQEEEMRFSKEYMTKLDIDADALQEAYLGTNWLDILKGLNKEGGSPNQNTSQFAEEMKKIKGYPVIIDGKYYAIREGGPKAEEEEATEGGVRGALGRFAKKAIKKKMEGNSDEPILAYFIELKEFSSGDVNKADLTIPSNYTEKK